MISSIKTKIKSKLKGLSGVAEVNGYEKIGFNSVPAVNVTMAGNDSEFWSVASNQRGYNFKLRVFINFGSIDKEDAEDTLGEVVDSILDAFDTDITLGGTALFLRAAPSAWGYIEGEEGFFRTADINLQAIKNINIR
jgi:hypothetical protein